MARTWIKPNESVKSWPKSRPISTINGATKSAVCNTALVPSENERPTLSFRAARTATTMSGKLPGYRQDDQTQKERTETNALTKGFQRTGQNAAHHCNPKGRSRQHHESRAADSNPVFPSALSRTRPGRPARHISKDKKQIEPIEHHQRDGNAVTQCIKCRADVGRRDSAPCLNLLADG